MRSYVVVMLVLGCCHVLNGCSSTGASAAWIGQRAPETRIQLLDGTYIPLASFRGSQTVLVFWAQWCARSKQLLQELGRIAAAQGRRGTWQFVAVSVDKEQDMAKVRGKIQELNAGSVQHAFSGNAEYDEAYLSFGSRELPEVFVIDRAGIVVAQGNGIDVVRKAIGVAGS